ncbi:hypothetical protein MKW98_020578, partial [Papaver atlanticum]
ARRGFQVASAIGGTKSDLCRGSTESAATSAITAVSRGGHGKATLTISGGAGSCTTNMLKDE